MPWGTGWCNEKWSRSARGKNIWSCCSRLFIKWKLPHAAYDLWSYQRLAQDAGSSERLSCTNRQTLAVPVPSHVCWWQNPWNGLAPFMNTVSLDAYLSVPQKYGWADDHESWRDPSWFAAKYCLSGAVEQDHGCCLRSRTWFGTWISSWQYPNKTDPSKICENKAIRVINLDQHGLMMLYSYIKMEMNRMEKPARNWASEKESPNHEKSSIFSMENMSQRKRSLKS